MRVEGGGGAPPLHWEWEYQGPVVALLLGRSGRGRVGKTPEPAGRVPGELWFLGLVGGSLPRGLREWGFPFCFIRVFKKSSPNCKVSLPCCFSSQPSLGPCKAQPAPSRSPTPSSPLPVTAKSRLPSLLKPLATKAAQPEPDTGLGGHRSGSLGKMKGEEPEALGYTPLGSQPRVPGLGTVSSPQAVACVSQSPLRGASETTPCSLTGWGWGGASPPQALSPPPPHPTPPHRHSYTHLPDLWAEVRKASRVGNLGNPTTLRF